MTFRHGKLGTRDVALAMVYGGIPEDLIPVTERCAHCPVCGATSDNIEADGLAGCPSCYINFPVLLAFLAEMEREPDRTTIEAIADRVRLRYQLEDALAREDFLAASEIRDAAALD